MTAERIGERSLVPISDFRLQIADLKFVDEIMAAIQSEICNVKSQIEEGGESKCL